MDRAGASGDYSVKDVLTNKKIVTDKKTLESKYGIKIADDEYRLLRAMTRNDRKRFLLARKKMSLKK